MFSPRGVFRIVGGVPFRRDNALHPVIVRGLSALSHQTFGFVVSAAPRLSTSALCVINGIPVISIQLPSSMNKG
jgi:hypothetical protein